MDDVMFAHKLRLLDVAARLTRSLRVCSVCIRNFNAFVMMMNDNLLHQRREMSRGLYYVWRYSDNFAADRRLFWHCYLGVVRGFLEPHQMHYEYEIKGKHELLV